MAVTNKDILELRSAYLRDARNILTMLGTQLFESREMNVYDIYTEIHRIIDDIEKVAQRIEFYHAKLEGIAK